MPIRVTCPSCGKTVQAPDGAAGKTGKCPKCGTAVKVPDSSSAPSRSPPQAPVSRASSGATHGPGLAAAPLQGPRPPRPSPPSPSGISTAAAPRKVAAEAAPQAKTEVLPWEIDPEVEARVEEQIAQGRGTRYPVKGDQTLNRLLYSDLKSKGFKLDLHALDECVAITEREPLEIPAWLYWLLRTLIFLITLPFQLDALLGLGLFLFAGFFVLLIVYMALSDLLGGPVAFLIGLAAIAAPFVILGFLFRNTEWAAKVIRKNPKGWLAIRLLFSRTPFIPRVFRRGDVAQLIVSHPKTGWFSARSLLAFVQDRPIPRRRGLLERIAPGFFARRRIYYVWFDSGEEAAEQAAKKASEVLGLEITRALIQKRKNLVIP